MKKDRLSSGFSGKLVAIIFALVLVLAGVCILSPKGREVLASDSNTPAFQVKELDIAEYTSRDNENNIVRTAPKPDANSDYKDWIFAGWYTDATCTTTVSKTTETGQYFAKFVPSEVLSAKCQVSADTIASTSTSKLRIVSTVDSLKYSKVGFDLVFKDKTIPYSTNKVYSKIEAATEGVKYGFSPNIFDLQSEYFITATLINIKNEDFDEGILIKPYWVTKDGTKVYGVSRYARVEDSYLGIVNVPVRLYSDEKAASGTATVTYDASKLEYQETYNSTLLAGATSTSGWDNGYVFDSISEVTNDSTTGTLNITATSSTDASADGMLVNLRLKIKDGVTLPKKNEFTVATSFKNADVTTVSVIAPNVTYMNFKIGTYTGTADTQWYDTNTTGTEFVITTPEELYGFASLVNNSIITNQKVYLGADIIINSDWTAGEKAPTYPWTPIGAFAGTLDGQGHAINGIYVNNTSSEVYTGLFQQISGTVQNLNLENSYVASNGLMTGSIAGFLSGDLIGVSSKAIVANTASVGTTQEGITERGNECGGLVGRFGSGYKRTISNCWFGGTVTSNMRDLGGLVGRVAMGTKTIEHCLNTGVVTSNLNSGTWAGGLVGSVDPQGTAAVSLTLEDSLNTGDVTTGGYWVTGAVIGHITKGNTVTLKDTYATNECYTDPNGQPRAIGNVGDGVATNGNVTLCAESLLTGYTGYLKADLDFYTDISKADGGYWVINADDTPTLMSFSDNWADVGWYFDDDDITTYEISTVEELYGLAALSTYYDFKGETIKLTADITVNEGDAKNWGTVVPKNAWTPISASKTLPFAGTFDGQGHTISGIYVNKTGDTGSETFTGLFGATSADATIKDLRLENSYIYGTGYFAGSIAGRGNGTFDTIYSDAIVISDSGVVGGIAGQVNANTKMSNCWFDGVVNQSKIGFDVGGLVGTTSGVLNLTIDNCLNTGAVSGKTDVGGIVGRVRAEGVLVATNNLSVGTISATSNAGNILANNLGIAKIASSYGLNTYSIVAAGTGATTESNNATYEETAMQGEAAYALKGLDYTNYWVAKTGVTPELKSFTSDSDNLTPSGTQSYTGWYNSWDSEYTITTAAGLYGLSELNADTSMTNYFLEKTIKLGDDIVVNEGALDPKGSSSDWTTEVADWTQWTPISTFGGTFDGQGHTISGIYVDKTGDLSGLFSETSFRATVKNLRLEDSYIKGTGNFVGSIAGRGNGTFDTIYTNAIVESTASNTGGLMGQINATTSISNFWFDGTVIGAKSDGDRIGGIAGFVNNDTATVDNCLITGTVSCGKVAGSANMGGLFGSVLNSTTMSIQSSLVLDNVVESESFTNVGTVIGNAANTVTCNYVYAKKDSTTVGTGTVQGSILSFDSNDVIKGAGAFQMKGLDFDSIWAVKEGETPVLRAFTSEEGILPTPATQVYTGWYDGGTGTYTITTAAGLRGLSELSETYDFAGSTIQLGADITLNEGLLDPKGEEADWTDTISAWKTWTPIGKSKAFAGTFDGQGHTISGLYVDETSAKAGLFGQTTTASTIQKLQLKNSYISGTGTYVGSIVGYGDGNVNSVYSNAIVKSSSWYVGGITGFVMSQSATSKIANCWFDGSMILTGNNGYYAGGILGTAQNAATMVTIENCLNSGNISWECTRTTVAIGGLCGATYQSGNVVINTSLQVGEMNPTTGASAGGAGLAIGDIASGSSVEITNTYVVEGSISGGVGQTAVTVEGTVTPVTKNNLLGDNAIANALGLFADGTTWTTVIGGTPVLDEFAEEVKVVADTSWYDASKKEFTITTAAELFGLSELSKNTSFKNKTIKLGADIATNAGNAANWATEAPINQWTPIAEFAGTFDGQGHKISGIYVNTSGNAGLFAKTTESAVIKDLQLKNSYIYSSYDNNGSIAGIGNGTFDTIYSEAIVVCYNRYYTGGIVGIVDSGNQNKINNTQFNGSVQMKGTTGYYGGGIVGTVYGSGVELTLSNCLSSGSVGTERTSTQVVGGLCGATYSGGSILINSCMHTGTFEIDQNHVSSIGSVIGNIASGTTAKVSNTYITSTVYQDTYSNSGTLSGTSTAVDAETIKGDGAFTMEGLDFTTYWVAKDSALPELKSFTAETGSLTVPETQVYVGWYDGSGDYTITTAAGLYGFAELSTSNGFTGETIKLGADITLNDGNATEWSSTNAPANVWQPIGYSSGFFGTFDGQGHTISGMYVNGGTGLFHYTRTGSMVKNLRLENSYIYNATNNYVGSIAGTGVGNFDSIYSNAIVETTGSNYYIGGLIGATYSDASGATTIMNQCWFDGTVKLGASGYYAGGMVGTATGSTTLTMSDCLMTGTVTGSRTGNVYIGGFCGSAYGGTANLNNCLYAGTMSMATGATGYDSAIGLLANSGAGNIVHTYVTTRVNDAGAGVVNGTLTGSVTLVGNDDIKGEGAFTMTGLDFTDKWAAVEGKTPELATFSTAERLLPDGTQVYTGWYDGSGDYTITTAAGLYGFAELSKTESFAGDTIKLGADITLNEGTLDSNGDAPDWNQWTPIGKITAFAGTFDGQGHTISGIYVNETSAKTGLFGQTTTASTIQNLRLVNSYISSTETYVGSIVGYGDGNINSVYSNAIVKSSSWYVGGIVGYIMSNVSTSKIANCWFDGTMILTGNNGYYAGGILGTAQNTATTVTIENCLNSGNISWECTRTTVAIGGLCGATYQSGNVVINKSLQTGGMNGASTGGAGLAIGYISEGSVSITDTYTVAGTISAGVGGGAVTATGTVTPVTKENLLGDNAKTNASALFTDGTTWTTITDGIPVLTNFKEYGVVESAETLLGAPLSRYRIVISEDATALMGLLAGYLQSQVAEQTGVTLEIVSDATEVSDYEIVLGSTTRVVSSLLYTKGTYSVADYSYAMKNEGNGISVGYSDSPALVDAFAKLLDVIAYDDATSLDITNTYDMSEIEKAESSYIRVMSSNIYTSLDTSFDHLGMPYQARAELLAECYLLYKPDFIGWQEADQAMRDEVYKYIAHEYAMVEFEMSGNNWCPIFYRKDLYHLEQADYYMLDSMHYCEWALYSSKSNPEEQFIHMNIHYNVAEATALSQAVIVNKMIKKLMAEYPDVPLAITGDYNFTASESVFKTMMRGIGDKVQSGSQILKNEDSKYYTWHILGNLELSETYKSIQQGPIDHVSITTGLLEAKEYKILHYPLICWAADHYPIFLDVAVK